MLVRVHLCVVYYRPDYRHLLQEFHWATDDEDPRYPRIKRFLDHWQREIDATIREILLARQDVREMRQWRRVDQEIFH
jgi:uncharacterized protein Usg